MLGLSLHEVLDKYPNVVSQEVLSRMNKGMSPRPLEFWQGKDTLSKEYYDLQSDLYDYYCNLGSEINTDGTFKLGHTPSPETLLTTMAYHEPHSYPLVDNDVLTKGKIADGFLNDEHKKLFDTIVSMMYKKRGDYITQIPKDSSAGPPFYHKDTELKMKHLNQVLLHYDDIARLVSKGKLHEVYEKYGALFFKTVGVRLQTDGGEYENGNFTPKKRPFISKEAALSGGSKGEIIKYDKDLVNSKEFNRSSAFPLRKNKRAMARSRLVYGYQSVWATIFNQALNSYSEDFKKKYSYTFKHRGYAELSMHIGNAKQIIGVDVASHDLFYKRWMIKEYVSRLPLNDKSKLIYLLLMQAPYLRPALNPGEEAIFSADPFDIKSYNHQMGLPSGLGAHNNLSIAWMVFSYMIPICEFYDDWSFDLVDKILSGRHSVVAFKDSSDDALYIIRHTDDGLGEWLDACIKHSNPIYQDKIREIALKRGFKPDNYIKYGISPYHIIEEEKGITYLGSQISSTESGHRHVGPNFLNYAKNFYMAESSIRSFKRKNWVEGFMLRREIYAQAYMGTLRMDEVDRIVEKHLGFNPYNEAKRLLSYKSDVTSITPVKPADYEVILEPSKLQWKFTEEEVSKHVLELFVRRLDKQLVNIIYEKVL
jgi:hypothetical protein